MSKDQFKGTFEIADGYGGRSRPQYFSVSAHDLDDDMTDEELRCFFFVKAEEYFRENIGIIVTGSDEFVAWAREKLSAAREND
jgi:hypothetical protein